MPTKKKPINQLQQELSILEAMKVTGWSRGPILRACWNGLGHKDSQGIWRVTLLQLESVGLGIRSGHRLTRAPAVAAASSSASSAPVSPAPSATPPLSFGKQHLILVGDDSGSMQGIASRATMEMEATLSHSVTEFNKQGLHTEVSTYLFGSMVRRLHHRSDVMTARAPRLTGGSGGTALYDAVTAAVSDAKRSKREGEATDHSATLQWIGRLSLSAKA